jgi:hypothetical protein
MPSMIRPFASLALLLLAAPGCALCSRCFDAAYPHYGGAVPRHDLYCGRVGSAFTPEAGGPAGVQIPLDATAPAENIPPGRRIEDSSEPIPSEAAPAENQPGLPEPDDRPPGAEALENALRGL